VATAGDELRHLAGAARAAAKRAKVDVAGARFRPHVTLARLPRPGDATSCLAVLRDYAGPAWSVEEIQLIASHLGQGPGGRPRYEVVGGFPLGPAG
jgi:2'-5' RNA ligase